MSVLRTQITVDEKGFVLIFAFGLPGFAHSSPAVLAVRAALELQATLRVSQSIGINTGLCFCGLVGVPNLRCEYAVVGDTVNTAARLAFKFPDQVVCGPATALAVRHERDHAMLAMEPLQDVVLKGKDAPLACFWPRLRQAQEPAPLRVAGSSVKHLVGSRSGLLAQLVQRAQQTCEGDAVPGVAVVAPPGMGKTTFMSHVEMQLRARGHMVSRASASDLDRDVPLLSLRTVVHGLLGCSASSAPPLRLPPHLAHLQQVADAYVEGIDHSPDLADLYYHVLAAAPPAGHVLIVEDLHWLDERSLAVLQRLVEAEAPGVFVLVSSRNRLELSDRPGLVHAWDRLIAGLDVIELPACSTADLVPLLAATTAPTQEEIQAVDPQVRDFMVARMQGSPMFAQEIARELITLGLWIVAPGGTLQYAAGAAAAQADRVLPQGLHAVLQARIDRLPAAAALCLKVIAVLGEAAPALIQAVYPVPAERDNVPALLALLVDAGMLVPGPESDLEFAHALVRESARALLPLTQLRTLHRAAAQCLQQTDEGAQIVRAAHHWLAALGPCEPNAPPPDVHDLQASIESCMRAAEHLKTNYVFLTAFELLSAAWEQASRAQSTSEVQELRLKAGPSLLSLGVKVWKLTSQGTAASPSDGALQLRARMDQHRAELLHLLESALAESPTDRQLQCLHTVLLASSSFLAAQAAYEENNGARALALLEMLLPAVGDDACPPLVACMATQACYTLSGVCGRRSELLDRLFAAITTHPVALGYSVGLLLNSPILGCLDNAPVDARVALLGECFVRGQLARVQQLAAELQQFALSTEPEQLPADAYFQVSLAHTQAQGLVSLTCMAAIFCDLARPALQWQPHNASVEAFMHRHGIKDQMLWGRVALTSFCLGTPDQLRTEDDSQLQEALARIRPIKASQPWALAIARIAYLRRDAKSLAAALHDWRATPQVPDNECAYATYAEALLAELQGAPDADAKLAAAYRRAVSLGYHTLAFFAARRHDELRQGTTNRLLPTAVAQFAPADVAAGALFLPDLAN